VTHDGGHHWTRVLGPDARDYGIPASAGWFFDAKNGIVLGSNGRQITTADGGRTWSRIDYPVTSQSPVDLHFVSATNGWLLLDGNLSQTTDSGKTWDLPLTAAGMPALQGMSWGDATHAWVFGGNQVYATADAGATWAPLTLPSSTASLAIVSATMTGPSTGIVSGYFGTLTTADGGATWKTVPGTHSKLVHTSGHTVWSINDRFRRSDDDGATWQDVGLANGAWIAAVGFADELHGWAAGNGILLHTVDGGRTWSAQPVGSDVSITSVTAIDAQTAWLQTINGQILATATSGL
jgi:photosystem II stability/assembly factor-like uncharacterized protein